jgi:hypothetical protein
VNFEVFAFLGLISTLLTAYAVIGKTSYPGMFASVIVLFLSFWVAVEGLYFPTGVLTATNSTTVSECPGICEMTNASTTSSSTTISSLTTTNYAELTWPFEGIMPFRWFSFLFLFFLGGSGLIGFALQIAPSSRLS